MKVSVNSIRLKLAHAITWPLPPLLVPAVALLFFLPSCVVSEPRKLGITNTDRGRGYYDNPPADTEKPYYFFHNRYYFGGIWEEGDFIFNGGLHEGRYHYGGSRFYGGVYNPGYRVNLTQAEYDELNRKFQNEKSRS
jgi:hypothetical protein